MNLEVACPSGLTGKVRGLTGRDGRFLTDQNIARRGQLIDHILSSCWEETVDPGVYGESAIRKDGSLNWGRVLQGDRYYALIQIRIAGFGEPDYPFRVQCQDRNCREPIDWEIDLDDLPVRMLPEESRERLKAGKNVFETIIPGTEERRKILPKPEEIELARVEGLVKPKARYEIVPDTGKKILFSLPIGDDETRAARLDKQSRKERRAGKKDGTPAADNPIVRAIMMRVVEIEGVDPGRRKEGLVDYLESLPLPMLARLVHRFDEFDCGVETVIEIQCPECNLVQEIELPFDQGFFFDRRKRTMTTTAATTNGASENAS